MNTDLRASPSLFGPVVLLGLLGDGLFRVGELGLNVPLWVGTVAACWVRHRRGEQRALRGPERHLLLAAVALSLVFAWRTNETLLLLNVVGLAVVTALLPLAAEPAAARALLDLTVERLVRALVAMGGRFATGGILTIVHEQRRPGDGKRISVIAPYVRGLLLAAPVLLIFGGLLSSADPVFGDFLADTFQVDPERVAEHVVVTLAAALVGAGVLHGALPEAGRWVVATRPARSGGLGPVEVGVTLGLVDLLFAAFVAFQLPYFFGGTAWVERTAGVTLSQYAREGFFQLVAVAALVLPLLLLVSERLDAGSAWTARMFRSLAGIQVVLVLAIMASAAHRMALYQAAFGLTEDRFFASAFMGGLAVSALWFMTTVLRGKPAPFARGALLAWGAWLLTLNAVNPERVIVETNLRRVSAERAFDNYYHASLGADAVPALVAGLPALPEWQQRLLRDTLTTRFGGADSAGIRAWRLSAHRARTAVASLQLQARP
ncbi:MAG: DUF4173 domain-containing protein [Gemmatimonadota bacterium]|nr:DUF4173 domain-containing protein [Gemmatimonadota bacterium]